MLSQQKLIDSISATYAEGIEIIKKKNTDYAIESDALSNFKLIERLGVVDYKRGILVRLADKFARVINLLDRDASVLDERLEDTLLDMINYLAILKAALEHEKLETIKYQKKERENKNV